MVRWVVVGGGSAGCVVAARLSERQADHVTVLEAGPDHAPIGDDIGPMLTDPDRLRSDEARSGPHRRPTAYLHGHGLGGSSLVNGGVVTDPATPIEGTLPWEMPWSDGFVGGALLASDPAARRVRLVRREGTRVSAADAYLRPVINRPNLTVRTQSEVVSVLVDGRRVVGVVTDDGQVEDADRVVLCAGAIRTPTILLRSGIDTPGIGGNLEDHPAFTVALRLYPDAIDTTAPTIAAIAEHGPIQLIALNHVSDHLGGLMIVLLDAQGRGRVRLPDQNGPPIVDLNPLTESDLDHLAAGVGRVAALLDGPAWERVVAESYIDDEGTPLGSIVGPPDAIRRWVGDRLGGVYHAAATCREGVVHDGGVVRGYSGLYVADASALPSLPRHDPYLHVIANAHRLAAAW